MDSPKYRIEIFWSVEDGGYIANVPDLLYCSAFGETYEEALREVLVAIDLHLETLKELDRPIPAPTAHVVTSASEPAERFAEALRESYQELSGGSVSAQELNAQMTQDFFNGVINSLRTQAESNQALSEDLTERQREQQEEAQALAQKMVNAYMDFLNSMFAYRRDDAERSGQRAPR